MPTVMELRHALSIDPGEEELKNAKMMICGRFEELCGPIIEVRNDNVCFVHFTAKE